MNATQLDEIRRTSEAWGWWFPEWGGEGGDPFLSVCNEGYYITSIQMSSWGYVHSVGPAECSDGEYLPKHGAHGIHNPRRQKQRKFPKKEAGYEQYQLKSGKYVDSLCIDEMCAGGKGGYNKNEYVCPPNAKLAGYKGRSKRYIDKLAFFCGCPKGTEKKGKECITIQTVGRDEVAVGHKEHNMQADRAPLDHGYPGRHGGGRGRRAEELPGNENSHEHVIPGHKIEPRDCEWRSWIQWTACSQSCGGGFRTRTRGSVPAEGTGKPCTGKAHETGKCNTGACGGVQPPAPSPPSPPSPPAPKSGASPLRASAVLMGLILVGLA